MFRFLPVAAALSAGLAAWLSQGTIGFTAADGPRLGVLSSSAGALVIPAMAAAAVLALARAGASLVPLALLTFVALPWLPFRVPSAFLLWVWPLTLVVWAGVLLLMVASLPAWRRVAPSLATAARPRVAAAVLACAVFGLSAWRVAPLIPAGDEPHYLVITQSLLLDGDLTIEDVHRRADYRAYYDAELQPHVQRLGRDGRIYSIHAPGLPAIIAPAFAIGGYPAAVFFLILLASAGSALAWHLGWLWTGRTDAAWFGWAAVTLPVTTIFQSFTIYPDGLGGVVVLTGLWALLRAALESRNGSESAKPWLVHGAALALLPWLHSRFAVLAAGLGALVLLRLSTTKNPAAKAVAFLSIPAASAIVWVGYFIALYGSADPSSPYAPGTGSFQWVPGGLAGLLFDQRFGVLTYAPVLGLALIGIGAMLVKPGSRRLGLELVFVIAPYLLTVTHFAMWWGGWSAPARFFAPILFLLAVPAASFWVTFEGRVSRTVASTALALTAIASLFVVGVDRGRLAFNTREAPALWLEWFGRVADLTAATPLWARGADGPLFRAIAVWLLLAVAVWALLRFLDRSGKVGDRIAFHTVTAAAIAIAAMVASTVVWAFEGSSGRSVVRSQLRRARRRRRRIARAGAPAGSVRDGPRRPRRGPAAHRTGPAAWPSPGRRGHAPVCAAFAARGPVPHPRGSRRSTRLADDGDRP